MSAQEAQTAGLLSFRAVLASIALVRKHVSVFYALVMFDKYIALMLAENVSSVCMVPAH